MGKDERKHKRSRDEEEQLPSPSASDSSSTDEDEASKKRKRKEKKSKHKKDKDKEKSKKRKKDRGKEKEPGDDEAKRLIKEAKKFLKQKLVEGVSGGPSGAAEEPPMPSHIEPIGADDYFVRNPEYSAWLLAAKRRHFNELSAEAAREHFDSEFVPAWNKGQLPSKYYAGMAGMTMRRTAHNWGLKAARPDSGAVGMTAALAEDNEHRFEARAAARAAEQAERKAWRADQKVALDELLPKATGREALVEARVARREEARARDVSPDAPPVRNLDIMGGAGDDSFAAAKAREAQRSDWRTRKDMAKREQLQAKLSAAQQAENDKMEMFRALVAKGPISIPKRNP